MALRILVTTDLSINSKTGLRFAIQMANQVDVKLVFFHIIDILRPTSWSNEKIRQFEETEISKKEAALRKFVTTVYQQLGMTPGDCEYMVHIGLPVDRLIVQYAQENHIDLICMGTQGAGLIRRFLGTYTSAVLSDSPIPVVAVPKSYRRKPISRILYASDFKDLAFELDEIKKIAAPLSATTLVYHYSVRPTEENKKKYRRLASEFGAEDVHFRLKQQNLEDTLVDNIKKDAARANASIIALFNLQSRNWVERMFGTSKSAELSFETSLPVLVLSKRKQGG